MLQPHALPVGTIMRKVLLLRGYSVSMRQASNQVAISAPSGLPQREHSLVLRRMARSSARIQVESMSFSKVFHFDHKASPSRDTTALIGKVDPNGPVWGRQGSAGEGIGSAATQRESWRETASLSSRGRSQREARTHPSASRPKRSGLQCTVYAAEIPSPVQSSPMLPESRWPWLASQSVSFCRL